MVLWLIKKRLLCTYVGRHKAFLAFVSGTDAGQHLFDMNRDVGFVILGFLTGFEVDEHEVFAQWIQSQDEQLNELSRRIDGINPGVFPALADTERTVLLRGLRGPTTSFHEDSWLLSILNDCIKHLDTLPGIEDWLAQWLQRRG